MLDVLQKASTQLEFDQLTDLSHLHPLVDSNLTNPLKGTMFMKSKVGPVVPTMFIIAGTCPALSADFSPLVIDVGQSIIRSHQKSSDHWPPFEQFQETVATWVGDAQFRVSLDMVTERKICEAEFVELVGLLVEAAKSLFEANGNAVPEAVKLGGVYNSIAFQAWWTWYSFDNKVAEKCKVIAHSNGYGEEL